MPRASVFPSARQTCAWRCIAQARHIVLYQSALKVEWPLPAVLAYNVFNRRVARLEAELEGFARDLRDLLAGKS